MWRLIVRVFPLVVFAILFALWSMVFVLKNYANDYIEKVALDATKGDIEIFYDYIFHDGKKEFKQRLEQFNKLSTNQANVISASELPDFSPKQLIRLNKGEVVGYVRAIDFGLSITITLYQKIEGKNEYFVFFGLHDEPDELDILIYSIYGVVLGMILIVLSIWSYRHWSELQKLSNTAIQISNGDFSARACMNKYASAFPIAQSLNQMAAYIQRMVTGQRELIHSVSHELRTPISRLEFGLELLRRNECIDSKKIDDLQDDVAELNKLVNELLELATVGQQYLVKPDRFEFSELLHHSVRHLRYIGSKVVTIDCPEKLGEYSGDFILLTRAITNLLNNAVKYAHHTIGISARILSSEYFEIVVEDDGPGIPESERLRIFDPFYRLQNSWDRSVDGYGLGLSIVSKVISIHHGMIQIETSSLGGAKFIIHLPKDVFIKK